MARMQGQDLDVDDVAATYVAPGSIIDGFVGLTPGATYYLQDAPGPEIGWRIGPDPGTIVVPVGIAKSTTELIFRWIEVESE